jgi:hypothetical protein
MGVLRSTQSLEIEVEEMRVALLLHGTWTPVRCSMKYQRGEEEEGGVVRLPD